MEYAELFGNEIIVKGPNENELTKTDNYTLKLLNGNTYLGGYYDSYTKRMYYPTIENYMFQGCSVSTGNTKFSSIIDALQFAVDVSIASIFICLTLP